MKTADKDSYMVDDGPEELLERVDDDDDIDFSKAVFVAEVEDGPLVERVDEDDDWFPSEGWPRERT